MMLILYTSTKCPNCPAARNIVREVGKELNWKEGVDFIEKLIDGENIKSGEIEMEGTIFKAVEKIEEIKENSVLVGEDFSIEALMYQVASTPAIVINEEAVFVGKTPSKQELLEAIKK